ncbi:MAG: hypothetical protein IJX99_09170 [Clostridia bacterium]|nr:hypothetical protein [Clostridia bacterium]
MEYEKIKLPVSLGMAVSKFLREEKGIQTDTNQYGLLKFGFLPEELELVTKVELSNIKKGALDKLEYLKNLEVLIISNEHEANDDEKISLDNKIEVSHESDEYSIEDRDFVEIAKCKNLKKIVIKAQNKLKTIDLNCFENLEYVEFRCNKNLELLEAGRTLKKLKTFICCDNEKLKNTGEIGRIIERNVELSHIEIDVMNFPDAIKFDCHSGEYNLDIIQRLKEIPTIKFEECFEADRTIILKLDDMINMHNKACKILHLFVQDTANKKDLIVGVENYLAKNVMYDEEAGQHVHFDEIRNMCETDEQAYKLYRFAKSPTHGASGAYNAIMFNQCICEGYTRAMQYLLKLKGIKSHDVYCLPKIRQKSFFNTEEENAKAGEYEIAFDDEYHSVLCIDDYNSLYADPCLDAKFYRQGDKTLPFVLKTKEEIEKTHKFVSSQDDVLNRYSEQSERSIISSIRNTEAYIENQVRTGADELEIRGIIK